MTPDEIITEIFRVQNEHDPDADPGDISIDVQDDMPLVLVYQDRFTAERFGRSHIGTGGTVQEALENALASVKLGIGA